MTPSPGGPSTKLLPVISPGPLAVREFALYSVTRLKKLIFVPRSCHLVLASRELEGGRVWGEFGGQKRLLRHHGGLASTFPPKQTIAHPQCRAPRNNAMSWSGPNGAILHRRSFFRPPSFVLVFVTLPIQALGNVVGIVHDVIPPQKHSRSSCQTCPPGDNFGHGRPECRKPVPMKTRHVFHRACKDLCCAPSQPLRSICALPPTTAISGRWLGSHVFWFSVFSRFQQDSLGLETRQHLAKSVT